MPRNSRSKRCRKCGIVLNGGEMHDIDLHSEAAFLRCVGPKAYVKSLPDRKPRKRIPDELLESLAKGV